MISNRAEVCDRESGRRARRALPATASEINRTPTKPESQQSEAQT